MNTLIMRGRAFQLASWVTASVLIPVLVLHSPSAHSDELDLKVSYYLQGNIGESYRDSPSNSGVSGLDASGNARGTGLKVLGGVAITPMFGAELGVIGLRDTTVYSPSGPVNYKSTLETLEGTVNYPVNADHRWWIVARAGVAATQSKVTISAVNYSGTSDQYPFVAGLGMHFAVTPHSDVVIDYDYLGRTGAFQNGGKQSDALLSVGLRFNF